MTKKQKTLEIIRRLKEAYPDADCTLDYEEAWKLLVSVRLAAQCTDERVNQVVPALYKKFPDVNALAEAPVEEIEEIVRPCGLGKSKARDISACMKMLRDEYGSKVPEDFDALLKNRHRGRHQRPEKGGDGSVETGAAGGGQRFLSSAGMAWKRGLHGPNKAVLRPVLSG